MTIMHPPITAACDSHCHRRLTRLMRARLTPARLVASGARPWHSASFSGARHWFEWDGQVPHDAAARDALLSAMAPVLDAAEWDMPGLLVADIAALPSERADDPAALMRIEVLTVAV